MMLTLEIDREAPSVYLARLLSHSSEVIKLGVCEQIADAIRAKAVDVPKGLAHFIECGIKASRRDRTLECAQSKAEEIASKLTELVMVSHYLLAAGAP